MPVVAIAPERPEALPVAGTFEQVQRLANSQIAHSVNGHVHSGAVGLPHPPQRLLESRIAVCIATASRCRIPRTVEQQLRSSDRDQSVTGASSKFSRGILPPIEVWPNADTRRELVTLL